MSTWAKVTTRSVLVLNREPMSTNLNDDLNSAPYGNLAVGAEAAAWTYFGRPARELSLAQAALLAGLPQAPTSYDPFTHADAARARLAVVLELMLRRGMLTAAEVDTARGEPLDFNSRPFPLSAAHFVEYIRSITPAGAAQLRPRQVTGVQAGRRMGSGVGIQAIEDRRWDC